MNTKFDEIFVIHLSNRKDRYEHFSKEFERIEIIPTIWWTTKRQFSTKISEVFKPEIQDDWYDSIYIKNKNVYGNVFNCTLAHYDIIKTSYERGLNKILICEDDIKFCNDFKKIEWYFNNFPKEDFGIIKYHSSWQKYPENNLGFNTDVISIDTHIVDNFSTMCYSMSRIGMKYYIDFIDNCFVAADIPFCYSKNNVLNIQKKYNLNIPIIYNTNNHICWPYSGADSNIIF